VLLNGQSVKGLTQTSVRALIGKEGGKEGGKESMVTQVEGNVCEHMGVMKMTSSSLFFIPLSLPLQGVVPQDTCLFNDTLLHNIRCVSARPPALSPSLPPSS